MTGNERRFLEVSSQTMALSLRKIQESVRLLDEDQVWWRPNSACNSVGNLLLHLCGNLSQWVLEGLGGTAYERHRTQEFTAERNAGRDALLERFRSVVERSRAVVEGLTPETLAARRRIQKYETDGLEAVYHVVEHLGYHAGQIVAITKQLRGAAAGIDFYPQHRGE